MGRAVIRHVAVVTSGVLPEQLDLWRACTRLGVRITIVGTEWNAYEGVLPWQPRRPDDLDTELLAPLVPAPMLRRGQVWWAYRRLGATLAALRPDLVHVLTEPWGGLVLQTLSALAMRRIATPVCVHGADNIYWHGPRLERAVRAAVLRRVFPRLAGFASWNDEGVARATAAGLHDVPTVVVPAVVPDPNRFRPADPGERSAIRARFGLPIDEPVAAFIGRLSEEKGVAALVDAFRCPGPMDHAHLSVWGAGPLAPSVRRAFASGDVRGAYGGPLSADDVAEVLRAVDVLVVPSRATGAVKEQFSRVVVEGMLSGCPVVAFSTGAIPDVGGADVVLVDEGDTEGLADAVARLLDDEVFRTGLAERARLAALARYDPAVLASRVVDFWDRASRPRGGRE